MSSENTFKPGHDYRAGEYSATGTVSSDRINLFHVTDDGGHHIGTLVSGSKTKIERFERDAARICDGLHALEDPVRNAAPEMLEALQAIGAPDEVDLVGLPEPIIRGMLNAAVNVAKDAIARATGADQ